MRWCKIRLFTVNDNLFRPSMLNELGVKCVLIIYMHLVINYNCAFPFEPDAAVMVMTSSEDIWRMARNPFWSLIINLFNYYFNAGRIGLKMVL